MNKRLSNRQFFHWYKQLSWMILLSFCAAMTLETASSAAQPVTTKSNLHRLPATQRFQTASSPAKPLARLENWRFSPEALQLEMTLSAASHPHYFYLAQPSRIVVDLPATKLGHVPTRQNYSGKIQSIRVSQLKIGITRIVMDLAPGTFVDPKQVKLQPISSRNSTQWVLRPLIASYHSPLPSGNYPRRQDHSPSASLAPQPTSNQPLSTGIHNTPQPPNDLPSETSIYNGPQSPNFSVPPPLTNLPPTNSNNQQLPIISVPPLSRNNPSQSSSSSLLPPANFPNQPGNASSTTSVSTPNFPVPNVPNYPQDSPNSNVINFGQPLPNRMRY